MTPMTTTADDLSGEHIHLPKPTYWPMVLGIGGGVMMLGFLWQNQEQLRHVRPLTELNFNISSAPEAAAVKISVYVGTLIFVGGLLVLLAAIGGWLVSNISERGHAPAVEGNAEMAKFAMWAFLGTECILFGGLIARVLVLWARNPDVNEILQHFSALILVSLNTFILLFSSLGVVMALAALQNDKRRHYLAWLGATIVCGILFLIIQGSEYSKLYGEGLSISTSQFGSAFFFLTGFHGLHVFAGVLWGIAVWLRGASGGFTAHENMGFEIFGLYWHFVDVVWIMIFTLVYLI
jgi:heme/copper-type cytochrome/quinol oxidase subunit 3